MITSLSGAAASCLGLAACPGQDGRCVQYAFEHGVNFFFTYGPGHLAFNDALRPLVRTNRDELIIASGSGVRKAAALPAAHRKLCKALGVDRLDVFLAEYIKPYENGQPIFEQGGALDEIQQWKQAGSVRFVGASVHDRKLAQRLARDPRIDLLMHRFNLAHRKAIQEVFPIAQRHKTPILAFTATRWTTLLKPLPGCDTVPPKAADCYRYCLAHPPVKIVLTAPKSLKELKENISVLSAPRMRARERLHWERYGDSVYGQGTDAYETRWP